MRFALAVLSTLLLLHSSVAADEFADAMTHAASLRTNKQFEQAADAYRQAALSAPTNAEAPEAHRLAILSTADLLRDVDPNQRNQVGAAYEALLREHLATWPPHASSNEARVWLAGLLSVKRDWPGAIATLEQIPRDADNFAGSIPLYTRSCEQQLEKLQRESSPPSAEERVTLLTAANKHLQPVITGENNRWPQEWTLLQCDTALALARLHLHATEEQTTYAERLLVAALSGHPSETDPQLQPLWEGEARMWLILALVRNGKLADAQNQVQQTASAPIAPSLEVLAELDKNLMRGAQPELGRLTLAIIRNLDSRQAELEPSVVPRLAMYRATAIATTGDRPNAAAQFAKLAESEPKDADIQERYALLLAASDSADDLRLAVARWKTIEAHTRTGGPRWRRARRMHIDLLNRLGEQSEAQRLTKLTRFMYPDWDDPQSPAGTRK